MKRVLLTGSHGYIGVILAPMLQAAGYDVVGLVQPDDAGGVGRPDRQSAEAA